MLLGFFVFLIGAMSAEAIHDFMSTPYGLVADVKMLNFFRDIGETAAIVIGLLVLLSMLIQNFWCRYLCPYGALLGITSLLSPVKIRRDVDACIDCGKCARACPSSLAVDQLVQIRSVECTACMACVAACPAETLCNSPWYRKRRQRRRRDGAVEHSHPLSLQQLSLASSWVWSWQRRLLGIGRRICHTRCMWTWFPTREKPVILTCSEPSERGVECRRTLELSRKQLA